jgi:cellobiose phosphorylase
MVINSDNSFTFSMEDRLPYNAWSHVLAGETFGYLATDAGTGHMWYLNARENKINRWLNDSLTTSGTETLKVVSGNAEYSLFAAGDGCRCDVTYGFGWAEWKKTIDGVTYTTTASCRRVLQHAFLSSRPAALATQEVVPPWRSPISPISSSIPTPRRASM